MLESKPVLSAKAVSVTVVECDGGHAPWSSEEMVSEFALVLVRSGAFRRRVDGDEMLAEPQVGYLERPGSVHQVAHPAGGDTCTLIELSEDTIDSIVNLPRLPAGLPVHIDSRADVAHRLLLKRARDGADEHELVERALNLAGRALGRRDAWTAPAASRRIADLVREALTDNPELKLQELAGLVGRSAYHVSRAFTRATGLTISHYRLRARARHAMDLLESADADLADVAAECGFADQPHMTRTLRRETTLTPRRFMRMVAE